VRRHLAQAPPPDPTSGRTRVSRPVQSTVRDTRRAAERRRSADGGVRSRRWAFGLYSGRLCTA
jgi:hypothetical protein